MAAIPGRLRFAPHVMQQPHAAELRSAVERRGAGESQGPMGAAGETDGPELKNRRADSQQPDN